jgi:hypothetical protein
MRSEENRKNGKKLEIIGKKKKRKRKKMRKNGKNGKKTHLGHNTTKTQVSGRSGNYRHPSRTSWR